jgi:hypothetical protein
MAITRHQRPIDAQARAAGKVGPSGGLAS